MEIPAPFEPTSDKNAGDGLDSRSPTTRPSLRQDARSRADARIIQGAMVAMAAKGFDATVEDIALEAGVSRRTVFRHFASQGELLYAAMIEIQRLYEANLPDSPAPTEDVRDWLTTSVIGMHERNSALMGRAFWDLHGQRHHVSEDVNNMAATIFPLRQRYSAYFAGLAWRAAGGLDVPPQSVIDAFSLHVSSFATFAFPDRDATTTGTMCADILWLVLTSSIRARRDRAVDEANAGVATSGEP